ncbi:hypothetical protein [Salinicola aestuarinus]|uniref:hypothetical protein n=1 Tax=Salinicola aestuarinus TaxID=1949082 RepID=UPI000DA234A7|nr:hypothetical protein [Salinicola aestuarinus]
MDIDGVVSHGRREGLYVSVSAAATPSLSASSRVISGEVRCLALKCDPPVEGRTLCRLSTDGGAFFFYREQFAEMEDSARDPHPGERLVIGASRLRDGSGWLHWLAREDGGLLRRPESSWSWLLPIGLLSAPLMAWWITALPSDGVWWMTLQALLGITAAGMLGLSLYRLAIRWHPTERALQRHLTDGPSTHGTAIPLSSLPATPLSLEDGAHHGIGLVQGRAEHVRLVIETEGRGRYRRDYRRYHFRCGGGDFTLRSFHGDVGKVLDPVFYRRAPLFIGEGDRVSVLTLVGDGEVHAILDGEDGRAQLTLQGAPYTRLGRIGVQSFLVFLFAFMMITFIVFTLQDWLSQGVWPDAWAVREAVSLFVGVNVVMSTLIAGVIGLIVDRIHKFYYGQRSHLPFERLLGIAYRWRLHNGRSARLDEFR